MKFQVSYSTWKRFNPTELMCWVGGFAYFYGCSTSSISYIIIFVIVFRTMHVSWRDVLIIEYFPSARLFSFFSLSIFSDFIHCFLRIEREKNLLNIELHQNGVCKNSIPGVTRNKHSISSRFSRISVCIRFMDHEFCILIG